MTTEALKELDVGRIAHRDAALFMWATDAHIPDALELYRAWGFRYVTVAFVWSKKTVNGKTVSNLAPWTLKNCELCLMGTRGADGSVQAEEQHPAARGGRENAAQREAGGSPPPHRGAIRGRPPDRTLCPEKVPRWDCWGNEV